MYSNKSNWVLRKIRTENWENWENWEKWHGNGGLNFIVFLSILCSVSSVHFELKMYESFFGVKWPWPNPTSKSTTRVCVVYILVAMISPESSLDYIPFTQLVSLFPYKRRERLAWKIKTCLKRAEISFYAQSVPFCFLQHEVIESRVNRSSYFLRSSY